MKQLDNVKMRVLELAVKAYKTKMDLTSYQDLEFIVGWYESQGYDVYHYRSILDSTKPTSAAALV